MTLPCAMRSYGTGRVSGIKGIFDCCSGASLGIVGLKINFLEKRTAIAAKLITGLADFGAAGAGVDDTDGLGESASRGASDLSSSSSMASSSSSISACFDAAK